MLVELVALVFRNSMIYFRNVQYLLAIENIYKYTIIYYEIANGMDKHLTITIPFIDKSEDLKKDKKHNNHE